MIISPEEPLARVTRNFFGAVPEEVTPEHLHTLHGSLFRKFPFARSPVSDQELKELRQSAQLADGISRKILPDLVVELKSGPCRLKREITFGSEAIIEIMISAQRPEFMSLGLFAEPDIYGDSLANGYIPDRLGLWSISYTSAIPKSDDKEAALVTASQRMPFKMIYGNISDASRRCQPEIRMAWDELKTNNNLSAEERLTDLFRQFQQQQKCQRGLEYPTRRPNLQESDQFSFLFDVLPSSLAVNRLETAFKLRADVLFAALGLATIAALGDQEALAVDDRGYYWIYPENHNLGYEKTFGRLMNSREPQGDMFCFGLNLEDPEALVADWKLPKRFASYLNEVVAK